MLLGTTVLRMALLCTVLDTQSALTTEQRTWLTQQLQDRAWSPQEPLRSKLLSVVLAWSAARNHGLAEAIQRGCSGADVLRQEPRTQEAVAFKYGVVRGEQ